MALLDPQEVFWTNYEPVQKNRFIVYMQGIPSWTIYKIKIPTIDNSVVELNHINLKRYVKGRTTFSNCTMELYQPIVPSGAQAVFDWARTHHEEVTGRDGYSDFYKRDLTVEIVGPPADKVQQFVLKGCFIESADFGEYDWTGEGIVPITLTIRPDSVILNY